ncbi:MAG: hypothetical protein FIA97_05880 [Methylococcaceae bacterium]|nr:hypothetical protein [Methylococcaceae bacterium]
MSVDRVGDWVAAHPLEPIHVDCATAVMLKILDGKCKMRETEKPVMEALYDAVKARPGRMLDGAVHGLIAKARGNLHEDMKLQVYEQRLLAETAISRPVMKGFKAMLRSHGLLDESNAEASVPE